MNPNHRRRRAPARPRAITAVALLAVVGSFTVAAVFAGGSKARAADVPATDPQAIFAAARSAWAFTSYPRYANYSVAVRYHNGGASVTRHYDTLEDLRRNIVFARTFSREEVADPSTPHGTNIGMLGMSLNESADDDPIGPLALAITYDFGISLAQRPTQIAQMGSQITAPDRYPVIGRTGASARLYNVRLIELLDNGQTYHLGLTPVRDPNRYRLREMWVSAKTYITQKILIAANFSRKPFTEVPWLISFRQIDGGPYIADERAQGALDFGDSGTFADLTISFEDLSENSVLPAFGTVGINGVDDDTSKFLTEP